MPRPPDQSDDVRDFPGLVNNADPREVPPGGGTVLVNLGPRVLGRLETRKGLLALSFERTTKVGTGPTE